MVTPSDALTPQFNLINLFGDLSLNCVTGIFMFEIFVQTSLKYFYLIIFETSDLSITVYIYVIDSQTR